MNQHPLDTPGALDHEDDARTCTTPFDCREGRFCAACQAEIDAEDAAHRRRLTEEATLARIHPDRAKAREMLLTAQLVMSVAALPRPGSALDASLAGTVGAGHFPANPMERLVVNADTIEAAALARVQSDLWRPEPDPEFLHDLTDALAEIVPTECRERSEGVALRLVGEVARS